MSRFWIIVIILAIVVVAIIWIAEWAEERRDD